MKLKTKIGKSEIHGKGLMAGMDLKPGENLGVSHVNNWPTKDIGENYNHSDNPNAMSKNIGNKKIVVPIKKLKQGEEITVDYRKNPELEQPEGFKSKGGLYNMMEYPNGGGVEDLLPNTFAQVSPLSLNYQGPATRQASEIQPGVGITLGRTGIGGQTMKNEGFDVTGTLNTNIPYSGGKPSIYGDMTFAGDPWEIVPGRGTDAQAYGKIGAGYDPNIGFNAGVSGGAQFQFRNMSAPAYKNPDKWKQGALMGSIGPEAGAYYRSKQLQVPSGYQGDPNDAKAGLTYGGRGSIEYQPFRFPLRLKAEGSLMYNPGAGKTIEGGDEAGKIQGKWQPGLQVSAKLPLSAFSKPKKTAMRVPPVKPEDVAQNDWVRNTPSGESPNMGYTQGRLSKSIWRTDNR